MSRNIAEMQRGISYAETMIAVMILGVCLVPALNALNSGAIGAATVTAPESESLCVKSHLEKVMAEPYSYLVRAANTAGSLDKPTSYSVIADSLCPALQTFIAHYDPDNTLNRFPSADTGLLFMRVATNDGSASFTTLVTRQ